MEGWVEGWKGNDFGSRRSAEGLAVFVYIAVRKWTRDESGGVDCSGACSMFFDGLVSAAGRCESEAGEYQHECDVDDGEAGSGMDDYIEPPRCGGQGSGSRRADIPEVCGSGGEGLSGVKGTECEDFDDGEAGVRLQVSGRPLTQSQTLGRFIWTLPGTCGLTGADGAVK